MWAATEAKSFGWGGITVISEATGIDPKTIRKGQLELDEKQRAADDRIRGTGGGRKKLTETHKTCLMIWSHWLNRTAVVIRNLR